MSDSSTIFQEALNKTADILARRNHSEQELRSKLSQFYDEDLVEAVVNEITQRRWLQSPEDLAESATSTWTRGLKSSEYISEQLKKRGLPVPESDPETEIEKMKALLKRKFKNWEESQSQISFQLSFEDYGKAYRYLANRGFPESLIERVIQSRDTNSEL